jgi:hypothetical protein
LPCRPSESERFFGWRRTVAAPSKSRESSALLARPSDTHLNTLNRKLGLRDRADDRLPDLDTFIVLIDDDATQFSEA